MVPKIYRYLSALEAPKRLFDEVVGHEQRHEMPSPESKKTRRKKDKTFYEIEIVEVKTEAKLMKVHYKGYGEEHDEWRPFSDNAFPVVRYQPVTLPSVESLEERTLIFTERLGREIKKRLRSVRKDDPDVRLEMPVDRDIFEQSFQNVGKGLLEKEREVRTLQNNRELDDLLGCMWDCRLNNANGDFQYVTNGTVVLWLAEREPIQQFNLIGGVTGKILESRIEQEPQLIFTFVCRSGNKAKLFEMYYS